MIRKLSLLLKSEKEGIKERDFCTHFGHLRKDDQTRECKNFTKKKVKTKKNKQKPKSGLYNRPKLKRR